MNLLININDFQPQYISFLDLKNNIIIEGNFSKIIYADSNVTFNGLYLHFQIVPINTHTMNFYDLNYFNSNIIKQLICLEHDIIEYYKELYKIKKNSVYSLKNQLNTGNIKLYNYNLKSKPLTVIPISTQTQQYNHPYYQQHSQHMSANTFVKSFVLKISGIWENKDSLGITYKIIEIIPHH